MSLKTETKAKLKEIFPNLDELIAAITHADEQDYTIPEIKVYSDADLATRDENSKKEGVREGKKTGIAIATKAVADKFGITETIESPDALVTKLNANFAGGDSVLKQQIAALQADKTSLTTERDAALSDKKTALFDRDLITKFPTNRTKLMNDAELLSLVKGNLSFEDNEGVTIVKKNGEVLRDTTTKNPLTIDAAINGLFTERKWVDADGGQGGRGGGDHSNNDMGGIKTLSAFQDKWERDGKNPISPEFTAALQTAAKVDGFDMNG